MDFRPDYGEDGERVSRWAVVYPHQDYYSDDLDWFSTLDEAYQCALKTVPFEQLQPIYWGAVGEAEYRVFGENSPFLEDQGQYNIRLKLN